MEKWIYILMDKNTNKKIGGYCADDPPWYGNGGDPEAVPHPFTNYFRELPDNLEIVLIEDDIEKIMKKVGKDGSILRAVNEEFEIDDSAEAQMKPRKNVLFGFKKNGEPDKRDMTKPPRMCKVRKLRPKKKER